MNTFFLTNTPLFHGISENEISELLSCLGMKERKFKKDEIVFRAGSSISEIGLVESGSVNIVVNFYWGNSHIFGHIGKGQALEHGSSHFTIPFDRQQLADYLAVDRSIPVHAMSNELFKMQKDGLITYHKSEFKLNDTV